MTNATANQAAAPLAPRAHGSPVEDDYAGVRELDSRSADGLEVVLLWRPGDADVLVRVDDRRTGVRIEFPVAGSDAAVAFRHPFAFAS